MTDSFYFNNTNGVVTLKCRALDEAGFVKHCFTTRMGGVSRGFLAQTNMSFSREDKSLVLENYRRVIKSVGFSGKAVVLSNQQHTDSIRAVDGKYSNCVFFTERDAVDGFITDTADICLTVFTADCVPIILADPIKKAVACIHSGWRGTAAEISEKAIKKMTERYGSSPKSMIAAIGPCIGACCYEVGEDVFEQFTAGHTEKSSFFLPKASEKYMLDLNAANRAMLISAGLTAENIHISSECTCHKSELYYSHRATKGKRGNMAAMIEI